MATAALLFILVYLAVAFGLRSWLQVRATGDTGFRGLSGQPGSPEWWAGILFAVALLALLLGPVAALLGLDPLAVLDGPLVQGLGAVLAVVGFVATVVTQLAMGSNWRVGVDEDEDTELVRTGPFALVRNPVFSAMVVGALGLVLMVPNVVAISGVVLLLGALNLQVRVVEEPHLLRAHGDAYARYAGETGRFVPGLGRVKVR